LRKPSNYQRYLVSHSHSMPARRTRSGCYAHVFCVETLPLIKKAAAPRTRLPPYRHINGSCFPLGFEVTHMAGAGEETERPQLRRGVIGDRGINEGRPGGEARLCRESALTQAGGCHVDSPPPKPGHRRGLQGTRTSHANEKRRGNGGSGMRRLGPIITAWVAAISLAFAANKA